MVNQLEVDVLDRALKDIITTRLKSFVGETLTPQTLAALAATAQTSLFDAGQQAGYDWRDIHFKVEVESYKSIVIRPVSLSQRAEELLVEVMEKNYPTHCNAKCVEKGEPDYDCPQHGFEAQHKEESHGRDSDLPR